VDWFKLNVVVEARACEVPDSPTNPGNGGDPGWAKPHAEHVAKTMLDNVVP
jgi:hypothetical protein